MYKCKLTRIIYSNIYFCSDLFLHLSFKSLLLMSCCYSKGGRWMNADNYHSHHHYHQQTQQQHQQQFQHQSLATCPFSVIMYHFKKPTLHPVQGSHSNPSFWFFCSNFQHDHPCAHRSFAMWISVDLQYFALSFFLTK